MILSKRIRAPLHQAGYWVPYELWHQGIWPSSLELKRQKSSEGWNVFTELGNKGPETTYHLVSIPRGSPVVQMHSRPPSSTFSSVSEGKGFTRFISDTVLLTPRPLLFPPEPIHLASSFTSFFIFALYFPGLICPSPSFFHLHREKSFHVSAQTRNTAHSHYGYLSSRALN